MQSRPGNSASLLNFATNDIYSCQLVIFKVALRFIIYFCTYYFTIVSSSVIQPYMYNVLLQ